MRVAVSLGLEEAMLVWRLALVIAAALVFAVAVATAIENMLAMVEI